MSNRTFHLGLCMAGSVSAGAYTAGVMDYLLEALEAWENVRDTEEGIPNHKVEIDLFGGTSGGGITAAMAFFAFRDKLSHPTLQDNRKDFQVDPENNILWKMWVEITGGDILNQMLKLNDIDNYHIPSGLNASFIDEVGETFENYIKSFNTRDNINKKFISEEAELFMTLFNVTGMKYHLSSKAFGATTQYVSEHRDLAHFKWSEAYKGDGRMEISFSKLDNLKSLIQAAKATGAFPIGLKARIVERKAKYIWDNPFFRKNNKFNKDSINLGNISNENDVYKCLNADGGTSNNEPVELMRDILLQIRLQEEKNTPALSKVNGMDDTDRMVEKKKKLVNTSVILIDPFPSYDFEVEEPTTESEHVFNYATDLVFAMNSQLQFDAKEAIEAYDKDNYGLHIIAPSRDSAEKPEYSIACGALGGFGGFLNKEYRIHDFFLGRHNCQSFLRKYFVVNPDEEEVINGTPNENYECVKAVIEGYKNESALNRFCFTDEKGKRWVPIIPDVTLKTPIEVIETKITDKIKSINYKQDNELPLYEMDKLPGNFLEHYRDKIKERINDLMNNVYNSNWWGNLIIRLVANQLDDKATDKVMKIIKDDLVRRKLMYP